MSSVLNWVNEDTPKELRVEILNDNSFKNDGRIAQGKVDKYELDTLYSALSMTRQWQREISLGNTLPTYSDWVHFKAESQYSIWKIAVSNYQHNSNNMLYLDDKGLDYRGEATSENLTSFDKVYLYNGDSGAGYTDNTTEAATEFGVAFNSMNSTSDYLYIGDANTFAGFDIDLAQFGSGYTLKVEYYSGASGAPWTQLLTTTNSLVDNTSNLTGSARVTFDIPGDWGSVSLFSGDVAKKYVRVSTTTTPSTVATLYHVLPIDNVASILSMSQTQINDEEWSWCYYSGSVYVSILNTGDRNYEGNRFISSLSSTVNIQSYFIYKHEYKIDYEDSSYVSSTSLFLWDTNATHKLTLVWNEDDTANRTFNIKVGGGDRTLTLNHDFTVAASYGGTIKYNAANKTLQIDDDVTVGNWFDQAVKQASSPTFNNGVYQGGSLTLGVNGSGGAEGIITLRDGGNPGTTATLSYTKWADLEAVNGLVKCNGSGNYSAITDSSSNWDTAYSHSQVAGGNSVHVSTTENTQWDAGYSHSQVTHDYSYITGNDGATDVTAAELETLTDGSSTALHTHAGIGTDEKVKIDAGATTGYIGAASNDGVLRTGSNLSYVDGGDYVTLDVNSTKATEWDTAYTHSQNNTQAHNYVRNDQADTINGQLTCAGIASSGHLWGSTGNGFLDLAGDSGATKDVRIWDTGIVDIEGQSRFSVYMTGNQSVVKDTWTELQFDTEDFDEQNEFNTAGYRFTATKAGYYQINGAANINSPAANTRLLPALYKNGTLNRYANAQVAFTENFSYPMGMIIYLAANDYIEMYVYHNNSVNKDIEDDSSLTYFMGHKLS